jgi:putative sterol carrier protein
MAVDIQKLFNEDLPAALAQHGDKAKKEVGAKYQINVTGDGGGEWFIDASDSGPKVEQSNPGGADCTISLSSEDFQKLMENPQANGMQLFFTGKLKVSGNTMLATKLQKLFDIGKG